MSGVKDCQCETNEIRTPESVANRPGRSQVEYRVGTHGSFLDTMTARLSNFPIEIPKRAPDGQLSLRPEIRDHRRFLGFLLNRSDPVACFLRRLLSFTAEELLDEHQAGTSEQELVEKVASELAKLLPQRRLTTDPQFNSALVTPAIHQLMCRGRLDPELRMRLNLLVLHVCLPSIFPDPVADRAYPLSRLTSRDPGDPAIALLDAW